MFSAGSTLGQNAEAALWLAGQVVWPRDLSYTRKPLSQAASTGTGTARLPYGATVTVRHRIVLRFTPVSSG